MIQNLFSHSLIPCRSRGIFYAALSGLLYGCLGYFGIKLIHEGLSLSSMLFWRFSVAALLMLIFSPSLIKSLALNFSLSKKSFVVAFLNGAIAFAGTSILFFQASELIGTGLAMVSFFTYPLFVTLWNCIFHRERLTSLHIISFSFLLVGLSLLVDFKSEILSIEGILLGLLSGVFYAAYVLISKHQSISISANQSSFFVIIGCVLFFGVLTLADGSFSLPSSFNSVIYLIGIALFATVFPLFLLAKGMTYIGATHASMLGVLEPIATVIVGVIFLNETVTISQSIGCISILVSSILIQLHKEKAPLINGA